ncbi:hypothetical protein SDRG_09495 [Saprolegnia diclina VS20]|uniref:Translin-associated factor X-interacting protein 1 N-terminal domain-containing protein n=1 Tax=Saprolegnia diclina (strain VS20) TaxID=1156394 RepID=T0QH77_SAPDV|nr:hypothetical protein SDRG_09495 [Saprolegnia diclina VS20]EQC32970.1 hypothetical protein SDRG_09495 [Saprolegnia diclina VS20]|eukprot:XP_008613656.1 hypothetical protein SDRG_09495 [Saprolegnia diclina VS20]
MLATKARPSVPSKSKWQSSTHVAPKPLVTKHHGLDLRKKPVTRRDSAPRSSNNEPEKSPRQAPASTGSTTPLRRCRSASAIRQKIIDASDFSSNNHTSHLGNKATVVDLGHLPPPASVETYKYAKKTGLASQKTYASVTRRHKFARSSATVLEMELAERLCELDMTHGPAKQRARLQVARDLFDEVILQDRTYAGILLKIRTEFNKHFDAPTSSVEQFDDGSPPLDVYLARTENQALKQLCTELQSEVDQLRHELLFQPLGKGGVASMPDDHEDDDVSLVLPETTTMTYCVPRTVPKLNFAALSPYQDDDDDGGYEA